MRPTICLLTMMLFAGGMFSSCKKEWYEKEPDDETIILDKLSDFEQLLDNNSMFQGTPALGEIASDGYYISEQNWETLTSTSSAGNNTQRNAYAWSNQWRYQNVDDYNLAYWRIGTCNFVLSGLQEVTLLTDHDIKWADEIKGNALFHRAKNFLDLSQLYAPPYIKDRNNAERGIVLPTKVDAPSEVSGQSSVAACYERIIGDIKASLDLLPIEPLRVTRGSKKAAFALLARTYLFMHDYEHAGIYADSCLHYGDQLMDFNDIPATAPYLGMNNKEVLFYSQMLSYPVIGPYSFIEPDPFALYDSADLRKTRFFQKNTSNAILFKGNYTNSTFRFSGLAMDEVYLIRAECHAKTGNTAEALRYLNDLLRSRWDNRVAYTPVLDSGNALNRILVERKKELLFRGLRWPDLRRLKQEILKRQIGPYELKPNTADDYRYTFPFPSDVLKSNPLIRQHPGW